MKDKAKVSRPKCAPSREAYCTAMDRSLAPTEANVKGLSTLTMWNFKGQPKKSWTLVIYRTSPKDRGVALNMCPWCGVGLMPDAVRSSPKAAR